MSADPKGVDPKYRGPKSADEKCTDPKNVNLKGADAICMNLKSVIQRVRIERAWIQVYGFKECGFKM